MGKEGILSVLPTVDPGINPPGLRINSVDSPSGQSPTSGGFFARVTGRILTAIAIDQQMEQAYGIEWRCAKVALRNDRRRNLLGPAWEIQNRFRFQWVPSLRAPQPDGVAGMGSRLRLDYIYYEVAVCVAIHERRTELGRKRVQLRATSCPFHWAFSAS